MRRWSTIGSGTVLTCAAAALAACAGGGRNEAGAGEDETAVTAPVTARTPSPAPSRVPAASPAPVVWEAWPPADAVNLAREPATGPVIEISCPAGGMPVLELIRFVSEKSGALIAWDEMSNQKVKVSSLKWAGTWRVPQSRLIDALRSALVPQNMVLVPMNLGADGEGYMVYDMNNPLVKLAPTWLDESRVLAHERSDGLFVATILRVRDMVDTSRLRQALTTLTTQTASIGRIQDVPNGRGILVGDFAPVVAAMKRVVDEFNARAVPPAPAAPGAPPQPR